VSRSCQETDLKLGLDLPDEGGADSLLKLVRGGVQVQDLGTSRCTESPLQCKVAIQKMEIKAGISSSE
jgi:hypothetical protein